MFIVIAEELMKDESASSEMMRRATLTSGFPHPGIPENGP
jgi:hypothetical protein